MAQEGETDSDDCTIYSDAWTGVCDDNVKKNKNISTLCHFVQYSVTFSYLAVHVF